MSGETDKNRPPALSDEQKEEFYMKMRKSFKVSDLLGSIVADVNQVGNVDRFVVKGQRL